MNDYKQELQLNDPVAVKELVSLFREIVKEEIKNAKFNRMLPAKVISYNSSTKKATIELLNDGNQITLVPNKSGENLVANQTVWIEFINNSSSNFYISVANS